MASMVTYFFLDDDKWALPLSLAVIGFLFLIGGQVQRASDCYDHGGVMIRQTCVERDAVIKL